MRYTRLFAIALMVMGLGWASADAAPYRGDWRGHDRHRHDDIRPARDCRQCTKKHTAFSIGSAPLDSDASRHSASEKGIAESTRAKRENESSPWSTRQKLVSRP